MITRFYTLGQLSQRYEIPVWKLRRVFLRGILPEPARAGQYRVISERELPKLEEALVSAGYLDAELVDA
jgi:hypothetical protein